jgi:glycosyltransferase involved in cell wall biosynthesis
MLEGLHVAVVVPARDEARWIGEVVRTIPAFVDRIVLVDDGSGDDTVALAAQADALDRLDVVRHARPRGVGAALASGYRRALARGADIVAVMAGDGQMAPEDLEPLLAPLLGGQADYVKGDRLAHPARAAMPLVRRAGSRLLSRLTSAAVGVPVRDSQCGYTAASARLLARVDLGALWPGYGYPNDLLARVAARGARIAHVPVRPVYRGARSGLRPWHFAVMLALIGRAALHRLRTRAVAAHSAPGRRAPRGHAPRGA